MNIQQRLDTFKETKKQLEHDLAENEKARGVAIFNHASTQNLDEKNTELTKQLADCLTAIAAGEIELAEETKRLAAENIKATNELLQKKSAEFLTTCEKFESGCDQFSALYEALLQQARSVNQASKLKPIMERDLKLAMLCQLAQSIGLSVMDAEDLVVSLAPGKSHSLVTKYHDIKIKSRLREVA